MRWLDLPGERPAFPCVLVCSRGCLLQLLVSCGLGGDESLLALEFQLIARSTSGCTEKSPASAAFTAARARVTPASAFRILASWIFLAAWLSAYSAFAPAKTCLCLLQVGAIVRVLELDKKLTRLQRPHSR